MGDIEKQVEKVLKLKVPEQIKEQLAELGLKEEEITSETAIATALYQEALKGNANAITTMLKMKENAEFQKSKKKNITREVEKEEKNMLKAYNIDKTNKYKVYDLIQNAAYMSVMLKDLRKYNMENGVKEIYKNGSNQFGYKDSVEIKTYNTMIKNYANTIKQINDILSKENKDTGSEDDDLL